MEEGLVSTGEEVEELRAEVRRLARETARLVERIGQLEESRRRLHELLWGELDRLRERLRKALPDEEI